MPDTHGYLEKVNGRYTITPKGLERLKGVVTDPTGPVYTFTDELSPVTIAAAMARLSRRSDDLRIILLDEFIDQEQRDEDLLKRVITAFGDDSVQQLVGMHFAVEDASNLLTKVLEWFRFGAYLEQSTRYIPFDELDEDGNFKYFVPPSLSGELRQRYVEVMDKIFKRYSDLAATLIEFVRAQSNPEDDTKKARIAWNAATRAQALDAIRPVLPVATRSSVGIFASAQTVEHMIVTMMAHELPEAREAGEMILCEARKVIPAFLERADLPDRGGAKTAYLADIHAALAHVAKTQLTSKQIASQAPVTLLDYWPFQEEDLTAELLFAASNLSLNEIRNEIQDWSQAEHGRVWIAAIGERLNRRHKPGRAFEKIHYEFEITGGYGTFRDLQRHRVVDAMEWQSLTPAHGYEVPKLVIEAGLESDFRSCFELAEELCGELAAASFASEAQYATLLGHRMRYRLILNARAAFHLLELRTGPAGHPGYRRIGQLMHEAIRKVHPRIAEAMCFVNQGEDPQLARLAAERATQYKLARLDQESRPTV